MKDHNLHFVSSFFTSLLIAIASVILGAISTAEAQNTIPPNLKGSTLNGLFTPTSAQRFFEEGRRNLEREEQILANPEHYFNDGVLQINTIDIKLIDQTGESKPIPNFPEDGWQNYQQ